LGGARRGKRPFCRRGATESQINWSAAKNAELIQKRGVTDFELDQEEQEILEAFEAGEFVSELTSERRAYLAQLADASAKKDKRINIRISSRDLSAIQRRALEEGVPYQTLVSSILHKYVSGSLYDVTANKRPPRRSFDYYERKRPGYFWEAGYSSGAGRLISKTAEAPSAISLTCTV
jgi:predicted DNA binding CopG/RHH family protein